MKEDRSLPSESDYDNHIQVPIAQTVSLVVESLNVLLAELKIKNHMLHDRGTTILWVDTKEVH